VAELYEENFGIGDEELAYKGTMARA
jgi:hypothetical protein